MAVSQDRDKAGPGASDHYPAMHQGFRWPRPERFNIAQVCCRALGAGRQGRIGWS
jgi:hypothetical protein